MASKSLAISSLISSSEKKHPASTCRIAHPYVAPLATRGLDLTGSCEGGQVMCSEIGSRRPAASRPSTNTRSSIRERSTVQFFGDRLTAHRRHVRDAGIGRPLSL
jgi:hypothetical protein